MPGVMPKHTLYAYLDGADVEGVAERVLDEAERFLAHRKFRVLSPTLVDQTESTDDMREGYLPLRDVGLNIVLPDPGSEPPEWISELEGILQFLSELAGAVHRPFIIGIGDDLTGLTEDLFSVDGTPVEWSTIRKLIGVAQQNVSSGAQPGHGNGM